MRVYKLTTQDNLARPGDDNETHWGEGVTHETSGVGRLCDPGWLHAYPSVAMALFMNPSHANIQNPKLWEAEAEGEIKREALKLGCTQLTTLKEIAYTLPTREQRIRFAILCALEVYAGPAWVAWAKKWIDGTDRTISAARAAAAEPYDIATFAAGASSDFTAGAAAGAAVATYATYAAVADTSATSALLAAAAATDAYAANIGNWAETTIDFDAICKAAMTPKTTAKIG